MSPTDGATCSTTYRFRVRAYGDGETYAAVWGPESAEAPVAAPSCPPVFVNAPYAFEVAEDAAVDDAVGTVSATDPDGDTVTYSITDGHGDGHFTLDGRSGAITVAAELDYETTASYTLTVTADDLKGGTATATVTITVTDVIGEGEPELLGGMLTVGSFNMGHSFGFGYTSGLTWNDVTSEGTLGTLDVTSFEYDGQTYTVQLAAYFKQLGTRDPCRSTVRRALVDASIESPRRRRPRRPARALGRRTTYPHHQLVPVLPWCRRHTPTQRVVRLVHRRVPRV